MKECNCTNFPCSDDMAYPGNCEDYEPQENTKNADRENSQVDTGVIILNETFFDFSLHCNYREMVTTGNTGWHKCTNILKIKPCSEKICPRVKIKKK